MTSNNTYVVELKILMDGFEKTTNKLIGAMSEPEAIDAALMDECHGDDVTQTETGVIDTGGGLEYIVMGCKLVAPEHVEILKMYF